MLSTRWDVFNNNNNNHHYHHHHHHNHNHTHNRNTFYFKKEQIYLYIFGVYCIFFLNSPFRVVDVFCVDNFFWLYTNPLVTSTYLNKNFYCYLTPQFFQEQSKQCKDHIWSFQFHWPKLFTPCIFQDKYCVKAFLSLLLSHFFLMLFRMLFIILLHFCVNLCWVGRLTKHWVGMFTKASLSFWIIFLDHLDNPTLWGITYIKTACLFSSSKCIDSLLHWLTLSWLECVYFRYLTKCVIQMQILSFSNEALRSLSI